MYSSYFENIRIQAHKLEEDIEKLRTTWELPQLLFSVSNRSSKEADSYIDNLWKTLKDLESETTEMKMETEDKTENDTISFEELLEEAKEKYEAIREDCDNLHSTFIEYGYHQYDSDTKQ